MQSSIEQLFHLEFLPECEYGGGISSDSPRAQSDCCASLIHDTSVLNLVISTTTASYSALETHSEEPILSSREASCMALASSCS